MIYWTQTQDIISAVALAINYFSKATSIRVYTTISRFNKAAKQLNLILFNLLNDEELRIDGESSYFINKTNEQLTQQQLI